jgi:hypothetical protein
MPGFGSPLEQISNKLLSAEAAVEVVKPGHREEGVFRGYDRRNHDSRGPNTWRLLSALPQQR